MYRTLLDKEEEEYFSTVGDVDEKEIEDDSKLEEKLKFMDKLKPITSSSEKDEEADIFSSSGKNDTTKEKESIVLSVQKDQTNGQTNKKRLSFELDSSDQDDESPTKKKKTEELNHVTQNQQRMKTV